jgi:hypothetical protein
VVKPDDSAAKRRKKTAHGVTSCGKTFDSYQGMPSGIPQLDEKMARLQPLELDGTTVNGIFPQPRKPWAKGGKSTSPRGAKE